MVTSINQPCQTKTLTMGWGTAAVRGRSLLKNQCKPLLESNNHNKQIKPEIKPLQQTFRTQIFFSVDFLLFESLESLGFFFPVVSGTFCPLQKGCSAQTSQTNSSTLRGGKQAPRSKALTLGPTERL